MTDHLRIVVHQIIAVAVLFCRLQHVHCWVEHPSQHALRKPREGGAIRVEDGASEVEADVALRIVHFMSTSLGLNRRCFRIPDIDIIFECAMSKAMAAC